VSFLLVIVATIFLVSGLFLTKDLALIFISIGCSALAGLMLVMAVLRSRPRPAEAPGESSEPVPVAAAAPASTTAVPRRAAGPFPIEHYDDLEVVEVLPLLGDLEAAQLEMVRQREAAGRAHPWILARIDALLEAEAETGEHEWVETEAAPPETEHVAWSEPEREWAAGEWSASDFPLESAGGDFDELEVVSDFPIENYDDLRVNDILALLPGLDLEDLKTVREVEAAGKARTSILSRIDTLVARGAPTGIAASGRAPAKKAAKGPSKAALALPIQDYDSLTVAQITAQLRNLSAAELRTLRTYEKRHKARLGVIQKIEAALMRATH
jgi:hypothetical protein